MSLAAAAVRHPTATLMLTVAAVIAGIIAYTRMGRLEDPEFTIKEARVITLYPGATAQQVQEEVTDRIEKAVQQLGQLKRVRSMSQPGMSVVRVEIKDKYNTDELPQVWDELRRKVNDVQGDLPPGVQKSVVNDDFGDVYGVFLAVYGDGYSYQELKNYADMLQRELLLCQDVAKVTMYGEQQETVYVEVSRQRLGAAGTSPAQLFASLQGANQVVPAGRVEVGPMRVQLQPTGEFTSIEEIGNVLLPTTPAPGAPPAGRKLYLRDVASIRHGYLDPPLTLMRFNGRPAIGLGISTVKGGNAVTMGDAVEERLMELQAQTPVGMEVGVVSMQSTTVTAAVNGFMRNLVEAVVIVIGVLVVSMGLRSGIIMGVILVVTILATFAIMYPNGILLQRVSLGALIIALGMVVDNAIVVAEGMLVDIERGMGRLEAAGEIVKRTIWPLLGATLVAALAFGVIGASQDATGEYCRSLFWVILISLLLSWVTAVTVTPVLGIRFLKPSASAGHKDPYAGRFFRGYRWLLMGALRHRVATLGVAVLLMALAVWGFGFIKSSFFPDSARAQFMIHCWLPQGSDIRTTEARVAEIENQVRAQDGVTDVASFVGAGSLRFLLTYKPEEMNSSYGMLLVSVKDSKEIGPLMQRLQAEFDRYSDAQVYSRRFVLGPGEPNKIQPRFRGPDNAVLRDLQAKAVSIMRADPNVVDINPDWRQMTPVAVPVIADAPARDVGLDRAAIAQRLQASYTGIPVGLYRKSDKLLPIIVRPPEAERTDITSISDSQIWSPTAMQFVPLGQFVLATQTQADNDVIWRRNRVPTITIKADPKPGLQASEALQDLRPKIEAIPLPGGYSLEWGGEYQDSSEAQKALVGSIPLVLALMVLVLVVLFDSLRVPLAIFLTVPLTIIGVTAGLLLFKQPFGFLALLGFLSLAGLQLKNAVVMAAEFREQMASGKDRFLAVVDSAVSRVRPITMGAATVVLGMIPLLRDEFWVSMAVTIMMGLIFATILTTIVFPVIYAMIFRIR